MLMNEGATLPPLRLHVRIRRTLIHAPCVSDRRHCGGDRLEEREQNQNPRQMRKPRGLHAE